MYKTAVIVALALSIGTSLAQRSPARWREAEANAWYDKQPWLVGANYIPSDAINEFEMFQKETFNAALNDKELGMAESIGMNTARVFPQDQLWLSDPLGFEQRLSAFLTPNLFRFKVSTEIGLPVFSWRVARWIRGFLASDGQ